MYILRSANEERQNLWGIEVPAEDKSKVIRGEVVRGFQFLEYCDDNSCWFTGLMNVNPNFDYIPDWFVNFMIKRVIYGMMDKIGNKDFYENDQVKIKMEERKEFWEEIRKQLNESIKSTSS